jgi:hypothetical protein
MPEAPPALEQFRQALGVDADNLVRDEDGAWAIEGGPGHGYVSRAPGGFHISICGWTEHGQERASYVFTKFARLVEVGDYGEKLFLMDRLPNREEAKTIRRWLALRR